MNRIRALAHLSVRSYRSMAGGRTARRTASRAAAARSGEMTMPDSEVFSKNFGIEDAEDLDEFASDFQNIDQYDKMHEREMRISKEKLKTRIVERKYFKCEDPPMLTWAEKEQIRLLYARDPVEWSEDRLSESFPATRQTIVKVLRSNWSPKSVKTVLDYDRRTKKNWDLYRAGKLVVSAELRERLEEFKDRKIEPTNAEEIARRIVQPKAAFAKPKCTLFSNIIRSYANADSESRDDDDSGRNEGTRGKAAKQISGDDSRTIADRVARGEADRRGSLRTPLTFTEFLKDRVENAQTSDMTPVDRVLVDEYKRGKTEAYKSKSFLMASNSPVGKSEEPEKITLSAIIDTNRSSVPEEKTDSNRVDRIERRDADSTIVDRATLETGIIAEHRRNDPLHSDYPGYIKIPAKKYKRGVTYRVEDRYYDDDGEFLYRVPGLKS